MTCKTCTYPRGNPHEQQEQYLILGAKTYPTKFISLTIVKCKSCQKEFYVIEDPGYHTPQYHWHEDKNYVEQLTGENVAKLL